ncbi:MAG: ankyrin repeat domain-containing protein [Proteobacteria bacterium]|nr:ankyrin repeat domain-containing protein [Pseudomonadota bacterium]
MAPDPKRFQKLGAACYKGDLPTIAKFLKSGLRADALPYNSNGDSLLMAAIRNGNLDVVKLLVEQGGANLDYKNTAGDTALSFAQRFGRADIIAYMAARTAPVDTVPFSERPQTDKDDRMFAALVDWTDGELPTRLAAMLDGGANPNAQRKNLTPLLTLAAQSARGAATYQTLIEHGADATVPDAAGSTVLHVLAAQGSATEEVRAILASKIPVDVRNADDKTPLHLAAGSTYWDALPLVKFLVEAGADVRAKDRAGHAPLDDARGDTKLWLLAQTLTPMSDDDRALMVAVNDGALERVNELCAKGANPCVLDMSSVSKGPNNRTRGLAAIHLAMNERGPQAVAERLLAVPVDPNVRDVAGKTPLHHVIARNRGANRRALIERLLALGADPNLADDDGQTPLFELMTFHEKSDENEILDALCAKGLKLDQRDRAGATLLDSMYDRTQQFRDVHDKAGFIAVMRHLVELGAPTAAPDKLQQVVTWLKTAKA